MAAEVMHASGKGVATALGVSLAMVLTALVAVTAPAASLAPMGTASHATAMPTENTGSAAVRVLNGPPCQLTIHGENAEDNAVQTAINEASPGLVICLKPGVYPEQLVISTPDITIEGFGNATVGGTVIEPNTLSLNTYDYDSASGPTAVPAAAVILVQGSSGTPTTGVSGVTIVNLQVNAVAASSSSEFDTCANGLFGIDFQASSGTVSNVLVTNVELFGGLGGCQQGTGVYAYNGFYNFASPNAPDTVTISSSTVNIYNKNGITCNDVGETCAVSNTTVTGAGGTTVIAQNGIQVGFGASGKLYGNRVSDNHYTGGVKTNGDYFQPIYLASGILVFDGGNTVHIDHNWLSGNDLSIALVAQSNATVAYNTIAQAYAYGISLDLNASANYIGLPIYGASPWTTAVVGDTVANTNVGVVTYDDNATIAHLSTTNVNVSVESEVDYAGSPYTVSIVHSTLTANVSGALLGNITSFQPAPGMTTKDTGTYLLQADTITPGLLGYPAGDQYGVLLNTTSATVEGLAVSGFQIGIYVNPTATATIEGCTVTVLASLGVPGFGIWAGNYAGQDPQTAATGSFTITGNKVIGPGGTTNSPIAGGTGIITGGNAVMVSGNTIRDFSSVMGDVPANTTGWGSGYDWWQGTQSAGLFIGCTQSATASTCVAKDNVITDNAVGVIGLLTNSAFGGTWMAGPLTIENNYINASGGYGIFTEMAGQGGGSPSTTFISNNWFDDTLTGAPAMDLAGETYEVTGNTFLGTSTSGDQGAVQGEGGGGLEIATASVEASDYWTYSYAPTTVTMNANLFFDTSTYWSSSFALGSGSSLSGGEFVTFMERGLTYAGTPWTVTVDGTTGTAAAPSTILGDLQNSSSPYGFSVAPVTGFSALPSSGTISVTGSSVSQLIVFTVVVPTYEVTFKESQLPANTQWYVNVTEQAPLGGTGTQLTLYTVLDGTYGYKVGTVNKHWEAPAGGFTVNGASLTIPIVFTKQTYTVTFTATFPTVRKQLQTLEHKGWTVVLNGSVAHNTGTTILFTGITNGTLPVLVTGPSGFVATGSGTLIVKGTTSVAVSITKGQTVTLKFHEKGLSGVSWCVSLDGYQLCSTSSTQKFLNLAAGVTYTYDVGAVSDHTVSVKIGTLSEPLSATIDMTRATTVSLRYVAGG